MEAGAAREAVTRRAVVDLAAGYQCQAGSAIQGVGSAVKRVAWEARWEDDLVWRFGNLGNGVRGEHGYAKCSDN